LCLEEDNFEKLFSRSDKALYQAKEVGKNRVIKYQDNEKVR